jgi:hypothetical protein
MDVSIVLAGEHDEELSHRLSRDLLFAIRNDVDVNAHFATSPSGPDERADVVTLGAIVMAVVTTGAVTKFLEVVNSWINRKPHIVCKIKRVDGAELEINAEFCSTKDMRQQTDICRTFLRP